jgi:hypothetical protein
MYTRLPGIALAKNGWNAVPDDVVFEFGNRFEAIHPSRPRPIEKRDQGVAGEGRFAPQANRVWENTSGGVT